MHKIALPYPHKCLLGFGEAKRGDQQEYLKFILVREVNSSKLTFLVLLRKIALPYPHKCLLGFMEVKRGDQQEYLKFILVREVNPVGSGRCACALLIVGWTLSRDLHSIFGRRGGCACFISAKITAESQLKSPNMLQGVVIQFMTGIPTFFCYPCRDKGKGQDVCVTSKEEDCFNCLPFSSEQKRKLRSKFKKKSKDVVVSKEVEDSILGHYLMFIVPYR